MVTDAGKMRRSAPDLSSDGLKRNTAHSHEKVPPYGNPLDYFFFSVELPQTAGVLERAASAAFIASRTADLQSQNDLI